jgi:hypothetical protein
VADDIVEQLRAIDGTMAGMAFDLANRIEEHDAKRRLLLNQARYLISYALSEEARHEQ